LAIKASHRLQPLLDEGLITSVERQLMSGKEATVFVVRCGEEVRCAKVYKAPEERGFRRAADYLENRKVRNSREARAMAKGSKFGRKMSEEHWQSAEVDALFLLASVGVRVPKPFNFYEGVVLMELVADADGNAAPRLNDVVMTPDEARLHHDSLVREVVRMLCAGIVHGDLSEFNILMAADGPVIIDLPQAVNAAGNNQAAKMLERDVDNLRSYFGRFAPELLRTQFAKEIWSQYEHGTLTPDTVLTGKYFKQQGAVNLSSVLSEIEDAKLEDQARRLRMQGG
jgi:RIO kinase 1